MLDLQMRKVDRLPGVILVMLLILCGSTLIACLSSCGNSAKQPLKPGTPDDGIEAPIVETDNPGGFGFADPISLLQNHQVANITEGKTRNGSEFESLLPNNRVIPTAKTGIYLPAYVPGPGATIRTLSYGMYLFQPEVTTTGTTLNLSWENAPEDYSQLWVGVANFQDNHWNWFQPFSASQVYLDSFDPYRRAEANAETLVVVVMTGTSPAVLRRIWFSAQVPPDSIYAVPEKSVVEAGEVVRVNVYVRETKDPLVATSVRMLVRDGNTLLEDSFNLGIPGGLVSTMDGLWVNSGSEEALFDCEGNGLLPPEGYTAYDFTVAPLYGVNIDQATGALFNFQLQVNNSTSLTFQSITNGGGPDRTYYGNYIESGNRFWANDSYPGQPGIRLQGWPAAILTVDQAEGDTPLAVMFDGSDSFDDQPGTIVRYEFDFGEGDGFENYGNDPFASHVYNFHGEYQAYLKVRDNSGRSDTCTVFIKAKSYDEVENNDSLEEATEVPGGSISGFRGNIGGWGQNHTYDGDSGDYLALDLDPGVNYRFYIEADNPDSAACRLALLQKSGGSAWDITRKKWVADLRYFDHVAQEDLAPYTLLVRGWRGSTDYALNIMRWPPTADLAVDVHSGNLPLQVNFNAGSSFDAEDNDIQGYWFDFGEGAGFSANGTDPTATHTYFEEGLYYPVVKVSDGEGNVDFERVAIYAGRIYDEIEPNWNDTPQPIELPVEEFKGSCGIKYDNEGEIFYQGYDGSWQDSFSFNAEAGTTVSVILYLSPSFGDLKLDLKNKDGQTVALSRNGGNIEQLEYLVSPENSGEMRIDISNVRANEFAEYWLSAEILEP